MARDEVRSAGHAVAMLRSLFRKRSPANLQVTMAEGRSLHAQGRIGDARERYVAVLAAEPTHFDALHALAITELQEGRPEEALRLVDQALCVRPDAAEVLAERGLALQALGRVPDALASFDAALAIEPEAAETRVHRARALCALGRYDEALADTERALARMPEYAAGLTVRAQALRARGRVAEAIACLEAAVASRPDDTASWAQLGGALHAAGRADDAISAFDRAVAADPDNAALRAARAHVLATRGRWSDAIAEFDQALAIDPFFADALINRGIALHELGRDEEALADFDCALVFEPASAAAWYNQGVVLQALRRLDDAIRSYEQTIALDPRHIDAHYNRGIAAGRLGRGEDARASYDAVIAIDASFPYVLGQAAYMRAELCDWDGYTELARRALEGVRAGRPASDPFVLLSLADDPAAQLACARMHAERQFPRVPPLAQGTRYGHDRIRVAYLSANFCAHAVAYLIAELFELHDRTRFELTAVSFGPDDGSPMLARIRAAFDRFIDARGLSDAAVARRMRELEIDIAVDLMGYTRDARAAILAHRPAPIQVNMLGYPGTMGAPFVDYIITDRFLVPDEDRAHYAEHVVLLPDSYQPNDRKRAIDASTPTRAEAGLPDAGFVFCCFNNNYKITPDVFAVWMRLLAAVPGSVLWLLPLTPAVTANLRQEAQARGIDPQRLVFAPRVPLPTHLARQRLADLFLDTLPYNAHTTASDALWAGLPIVTCAGRSFPSRVAGSLLHAVGVPELVTTSLPDYEALVLALARDPPRLARIRERIAQQRSVAPLFDSDRYRRHLESALRTMHERHLRGEPLAGIEVPAEPG